MGLCQRQKLLRSMVILRDSMLLGPILFFPDDENGPRIVRRFRLEAKQRRADPTGELERSEEISLE